MRMKPAALKQKHAKDAVKVTFYAHPSLNDFLRKASNGKISEYMNAMIATRQYTEQHGTKRPADVPFDNSKNIASEELLRRKNMISRGNEEWHAIKINGLHVYHTNPIKILTNPALIKALQCRFDLKNDVMLSRDSIEFLNGLVCAGIDSAQILINHLDSVGTNTIRVGERK